MKILQYLFFTTVCVFFLSCQGKQRKAGKVVKEWKGKEIRFPEGIPCQTVDQEITCMNLTNKTYKILAYTDSTDCISCRLKLSDWKRLIAEVDTLFPGKLDFLFFFQPKRTDVKDLIHVFKREKFDYPVFIDTENRIDQINRFPPEMEYQCFLLDSGNNVVLVGNPTLNPLIWELYKQQITGQAAAKPEQKTKIETECTQIYLENMRVAITDTCIFEIENSGAYPFVLLDIKASCGCIIPSWDRQPLKPSQKMTIRVEVKPNKKGFFNKTILLYGNAVNSPLKVSILGNVK